MTINDEKKSRRISVDLPEHLIDEFDALKKEWGLRSRGAVFTRLLEYVLPNEDNDEIGITKTIADKAIKTTQVEEIEDSESTEYYETKALVLIGQQEITDLHDPSLDKGFNQSNNNPKTCDVASNSRVIDLPGFVRKKSKTLRETLSTNKVFTKDELSNLLPTVSEVDLEKSRNAAEEHWNSLYGQAPGDTVIEASMLWLSRDIWTQTDEAEGRPFTWSAANRVMKSYCKSWSHEKPALAVVLVIAGVLEDPFATNTLPERMPTLIRRFVSKFKRSKNVTSFQTLESTMTVHGALKLLGLPTQAGSSVTLFRIREAYKILARQSHPDAGGSTEAMRRLNEAYQLLKELYRH